MRLPVNLLMGKIGKLKINVPWNQLSSKPVEVVIESVNVVVTPKGRNEWTDNTDTIGISEEKRTKFLENFTQLLFNEMIVSIKQVFNQALTWNKLSRKPKKSLRRSRECWHAWALAQSTIYKYRFRICMCVLNQIMPTSATTFSRWVSRLASSRFTRRTTSGRYNFLTARRKSRRDYHCIKSSQSRTSAFTTSRRTCTLSPTLPQKNNELPNWTSFFPQVQAKSRTTPSHIY